MSRKPGDQITKDPDSIEPQGFDWTDWLEELGDSVTISTSTWAVSPTGGITLSGDSIITGSLKTQVTLTGGTVHRRYTVTNRIVTSSGVHDDRSFVVLVTER